MDEPGHKAQIEKEQKQVTRIYAAMVAMMIFSLTPSAVLQVVAILLMFYAMIGAYTLRAKSKEESLVHNHMTFLIRTFWISSLFFAIGLVPYGIWIAQKLTADDINGMGMAVLNGNMAAMTPLVMPAIVTLGPSIVYFIYRIAKGLARAMKGYRLSDVNHWF